MFLRSILVLGCALPIALLSLSHGAEPEPARARLTQRELTAQLAQVPEVGWSGLDKKGFTALWTQLLKERGAENGPKSRGNERQAKPVSLETQRQQWDKFHLTPLGEKECQSNLQRADTLAETAQVLRRSGLVSVPDRKGVMVPPKLTAPLGSFFYDRTNFPLKSGPGNVISPDLLPALTQMMEPEDVKSRAALVELLSKSEGPAGTAALALRAVFDIDADVRAYAVEVLQARPPADYRPTFVAAFRHPWAPAADHAAEALVALKDQGALRQLRGLLDEPSPSAPLPRSDTDSTPVVRELVRTNHMLNCVLCHAVGTRESALAGAAPMPETPLTPQYYESRGRDPSPFVRADVTYLRQDFSLTQPVANADPWPAQQRFDFLVRTRPATKEEIAAAKPDSYPQREAARFAIRELERLP